jgi:uncharacterized protein (DUF58 family)
MLTSRGWWFIIWVCAILALAVIFHHALLVILCLALLFWFSWEWLLFAVRGRVVARQLEVVRLVCDERGPVDSLWAGHTFTVDVEVRLREWLGLSYVTISDRIPFGADHVAGDLHCDGPIRRGRPLHLSYTMRCPDVGRLRFEGVKLRLADLQGFFHRTTFLRSVVVYRVLPRLVDGRGRPATKKRHNLLPPPGVHRLRRPGSGSELLDLRDYLPGDPPKTIAWKVSARRDRLITKEFESEVPIRCTLFVDTSNSVRIGAPGRNALGRLVEIAASVAQANTGDRDLTGLCLFDETGAVPVRPARGSRHLASLLNVLVDAGSKPPATEQAPLDPLMRLAHAFAEEIYPDLMRPEVNHFPFWMSWLITRPLYLIRRPTVGDLLYRCLPLLLVAYAFWVVGLTVWALLGLAHLLISVDTPGPLILLALSTGGLSLLLVFALAAVHWFFPQRRRADRWRKRLAAFLSVRYGLAPAGLSLLLEDDEQFGLYLQRFLAEHHVPYPLPLYDALGRYRFASPEKVAVLSAALTRAVGKEHDNELFVLMADLLELEEALEPLAHAVRVALARHHQVVVVCPWPPGAPPPTAAGSETGSIPFYGREMHAATNVRALVQHATTRRLHRAYHALRRRFARMGVPVISARSDEAIPTILERMDRLRMLGRRR